ncbi:MAG: hypothetical protein AAGD06_10805 [Acidobacteriota bacterium]
MDLSGPFGRYSVSSAKLSEIREKLAGFESRDWNDILVKDQKRNHSVRVDRLDARARKRLAEIKKDDFEELVSLRLSGKERIWGVRIGSVLELLWWDPLHEVCPSNLRNT